MINNKLEKIKQTALNNKEGFSLNLDSMELCNKKKGFIISITNNKNENLNLLATRVLYLREVIFKDLKNVYVGGWNDGLNYYVDLSLFINDKRTAVQTARIFKQKAIFNLKNKSCINVK